MGQGPLVFLSDSSSAAKREAARPLAAIVSGARFGWNGIRLLVSHAVRGDVLDKDRYTAFISYRHAEPDRGWAIWLHGALESYVIPSPLRKEFDRRRIGRIFRDEEELAASPHLSEDIREALRRSNWLIVVCSPRAKSSQWVDAEIQYFRELGRGDRILALLIEGEPATAFPASLFEIRQSAEGEAVFDYDEPLAADVRPDRERSAGKARRFAKFRLLATILGYRFDDLRGREEERRFRRTVAMMTIGLVGLAVVGLLVFFLEASRREAAQRTADANQKAAESINSDLDLKFGQPLAPRQRQALWKLAVADEPIKRDFVTILASPDETIRSSPGFARISRALGPLRPSTAEVETLLEPLLKQIGQKTDPHALRELAQALEALGPKLTEAQASQALDPVLRRIGQETDPNAFLARAEALEALAPRLSEARANEALAPWLQLVGQNEFLLALRALPRAIQALAPKLTEAQANQALDRVLQDQELDPDALMAQAIRALAPKLTEAHARQALDPVLKRIGQTDDPEALLRLAAALRALPSRLTDVQASQALDPVLKRIGQTDDPEALLRLAAALQALPSRLTDVQASQALDPVLTRIGQTDDPEALHALALALQTLAPKLTEAQASEELEPVLRRIGQKTNPSAILALAQGLQALPARLTEPQAREALDVVLAQIGQKNFVALLAGAQALKALGPKLTEAQASQALDSVLKQIDQWPHPYAQRALAEALAALRAKLTEAQASKAPQC
jgi:hypothetical protein